MVVLASLLAWPSAWIYARRPHLVLPGRTRALQPRRTLLPRNHASETDGWFPAVLASAVHPWSLPQSPATAWRVHAEGTRRLSCNLCQLICNLQQTPFPSPLCASVLFLAAHLCVCVSITTPLCKMSRASNMQKCSEHAALLRGWCNYAHNLEVRKTATIQRLVQLCPQPRS